MPRSCVVDDVLTMLSPILIDGIGVALLKRDETWTISVLLSFSFNLFDAYQVRISLMHVLHRNMTHLRYFEVYEY